MKLATVWASAPIFRHLGREERDLLERQALRRSYEPGRVLAHAGESWPYLLLVEQGEIQVVKVSPGGRSLTPIRLRPGDIFLGRPLFEDEIMPVLLEATASCNVLLWYYREILPTVQKNPQAMWDLCRHLSQLMLRATDFIESLAFQPLFRRLARLLLEEFEQLEGCPQIRTISLDRMAAQIGSTREVVCRLLQRFCDTGFISLTRSELVFTNLTGLRNAADLEAGRCPNSLSVR